jgi:hypothetical protein
LRHDSPEIDTEIDNAAIEEQLLVLSTTAHGPGIGFPCGVIMACLAKLWQQWAEVADMDISA